MNINQLSKYIIDFEVKRNLEKWTKKIGMDNILDLIKRNREYKLTDFYVKELRKRGFKL